jgi:hypothetical protein
MESLFLDCRDVKLKNANEMLMFEFYLFCLKCFEFS